MSRTNFRFNDFRVTRAHAPIRWHPATASTLAVGRLLKLWETEANFAYDAHNLGWPRGPVSGFQSLDRELGGCFMPGLHFVHRQPGTGETAFGLQLAATRGTPATFLSCEMSALELLRRHTARVTQTYLGKFKTGAKAPVESMALVRGAVAAAP